MQQGGDHERRLLFRLRRGRCLVHCPDPERDTASWSCARELQTRPAVVAQVCEPESALAGRRNCRSQGREDADQLAAGGVVWQWQRCGWGKQASEITRLGQVWMAALCQGCRRPFSRAVYRSQSRWRASQRISGARLARTGSSCWGDRQASPTLRQVVGKIVIREQSREYSERRRQWAVIITTQIFLPPLPHDMQRWQTSLQEFSMHDMSAESSRHPPRATRRACA